MAVSGSDHRGSRGSGSREDQERGYWTNAGQLSREDYWEETPEDEEDYEEFARERDRMYGVRGGAGEDARGRGAARGAAGGPGRGGRTGSRGNTDSAEKGSRVETGRGGTQRADVPVEDPERFRESAESGTPAPAKGKKRKGSCLGVFLRILLVLVLLAAVAVGFLFYRVKDVLEMQRVDSVDLEGELRPGISSQVNNDERMEGYKNIALFGVDSRSGDLLEGDNRSDTIMICSINEETGEIRLVSVFRDTMLEVDDGYYTKANTAYALGGPARAINMLNRCFDLNILDFVTVGFEGLAHTIDALGGIEIEIDEEERGYLNQYVHDMHVELGTDDTPVEETGLVKLTGIQATAYSRIRYTAGDDFKRAERQRTVLQKTLEKAREASPTTLVDVANNVVGDMATSLSSKEIVSLILKAGSLDLAETGGLPLEEYRAFGESYEDGSFVLPMTLGDNVKWLHEFLFEEEDYQLSEEASAVDLYLQNNYWPAY